MSMTVPETDTSAAKGPVQRRLAGGRDWAIREFICDAGPDDPYFEEQHDCVSLALVVEGTFNYASDAGSALLHPGALLLCNHAACYQCGHEHGVGDRCISLQIAPEAFAEIAATAAGKSTYRFPTVMLPASHDMLPHTAILEAAKTECDPLLAEEKIVLLIEAALGFLSGEAPKAFRASARDQKRISRALRHIEKSSGQALDLDQLAQIAGMSKFHFLRVFRHTVGLTPYQYLLNQRLRRVALRLKSTQESISTIAFDAGFGDLSTFNNIFRQHFGQSPTGFRG